jgi:hypothetical protein
MKDPIRRKLEDDLGVAFGCVPMTLDELAKAFALMQKAMQDPDSDRRSVAGLFFSTIVRTFAESDKLTTACDRLEGAAEALERGSTGAEAELTAAYAEVVALIRTELGLEAN